MATELAPVLLESWTVIDRWWEQDGGVRREFAVADWDGRRIVFVRERGDKTWRVYGPDR